MYVYKATPATGLVPVPTLLCRIIIYYRTINYILFRYDRVLKYPYLIYFHFHHIARNYWAYT